MFKSITNSLKKVFGTKQAKDINLYMPLVEEVNEVFGQLQNLSNDELRNKTREFKSRIAEHLAAIDKDIDDIHREANEQENLLEKEELFREMDKLKEERDKHLEDILKELLPEAFAVVKETARRFMENPVLEASATDHDRDLSFLLEISGFDIQRKCVAGFRVIIQVDIGGLQIRRCAGQANTWGRKA